MLGTDGVYLLRLTFRHVYVLAELTSQAPAWRLTGVVMSRFTFWKSVAYGFDIPLRLHRHISTGVSGKSGRLFHARFIDML